MAGEKLLFSLIFFWTSKADGWSGAIYFVELQNGIRAKTCQKLLFVIMLLLIILRKKVNKCGTQWDFA